MLELSNRTQDRAQLFAAYDQLSTSPENHRITIPQLVDFARKHASFLIVTLLVFIGFGIAYLTLIEPRYTAKTLLMLDARRPQVFQQQSVVGEMSFDDVTVASQVEILKSVSVAEAVVRSLALANDPEFTGGVQGFIPGMLGTLLALVSGTPERLESHDGLVPTAVRKLSRELTVNRVGRTHVLDISYTSLDRHKAARIADAVAEAYILDQLDTKLKATRNASTWLQERLSKLRDEATESERAVQEFRVQNQLVETNGRTVTDQQLGEINTQLVAARAGTAEARARLNQLAEINGEGAVVPNGADALRSDVINRLRQQWIDESKREAELSAKYGREHLAAVNLRKGMAQIQRLTAEELRRTAETFRNEFEVARDREKALEQSLASVMHRVAANKHAEVAMRALESSAQSYRTLHDSFLSRFVEATQQLSYPSTDARIITPARVGERSRPGAASVLAFSLVAGLSFGIGGALVREQLDRAFRLPAQVKQALGLECLGVLPAADSVAVSGKVASILEKRLPPSGQRRILRNLGVGRYVVAEPFTRYAETLRAVKIAADTNRSGGHIQVIGTVSAVPGEGKSTVALNMAELLAQMGSRVLLVDGDLRNPSLSRLIVPSSDRGLIEVVHGRADLSEVVWTDPLTGMHFLPTNLDAMIPHTSALMSSHGMQKVFATARDEYDYVLVDLPPMMSIVDARAAAPLMDGLLLVIEWGKTPPEVVAEAVQSAEVIRERIFGVVLNKADRTALKRLEAYKGAKYHRYYSDYQRA